MSDGSPLSRSATSRYARGRRLERDAWIRRNGFTMIEMLIVMAIAGVLSAIAWPPLVQVRDRLLVARAIGDIQAMQIDVLGYEATYQTTPPSLVAVGRGSMLDPWGRPYRYLSFAHAGGSGGGAPTGARRDRHLKPVNSTFDLYSVGPDGLTKDKFDAKDSLDDVVRAMDGDYVGLAKSF